ncbi:MAG: glycosyltransferase family 4 protein [Longimicrobiales bacterium]
MPSSPKRVLMLETNRDGTVGGSHQALFDLAVNLDSERFQPVVAFYEDNVFADRLRSRGIEVHLVTGIPEERAVRFGERGRLRKIIDVFIGAPYRRFRFMRDLEIDLLHLNNSPLGALDDWLPAAKLAGIPCVSHAMGDALLPTSLKGRILLPLYDRVIAISRHVADGMERQGVPSHLIELVYLGVDVDEFRQRRTGSPSEIRAALGIGTEPVLAVMAGNVRQWKGQHAVIRSLSELDSETLGRLRVLFAGAVGEEYEDYYEELLGLVREFGLEDRITFLGGRNDLPDLFGAADIAIHASQIPEPFGLVVVEALAVGTPVVGGLGGGPSEVLTPDCGRLWETSSPSALAQVLSDLINDPEELSRLGSNAEARARRFDVSQFVAGVERVYRTLLGLPQPA